MKCKALLTYEIWMFSLYVEHKEICYWSILEGAMADGGLFFGVKQATEQPFFCWYKLPIIL